MPQRPKTARRAGAVAKPAKKSPATKSTASKPTTPTSFREWRERAGVPLEGTRYMRPRDWRNLFISGATQEEAAAYLERNRYDAVDARGLRGKR
jgi:hypothetical protein